MANSYILLADLKAELRYCGCQATEVLGGKKLNKGSIANFIHDKLKTKQDLNCLLDDEWTISHRACSSLVTSLVDPFTIYLFKNMQGDDITVCRKNGGQENECTASLQALRVDNVEVSE
ncbi:hypothetical protein YC2023_008806 [Brassica napus]